MDEDELELALAERFLAQHKAGEIADPKRTTKCARELDLRELLRELTGEDGASLDYETDAWQRRLTSPRRGGRAPLRRCSDSTKNTGEHRFHLRAYYEDSGLPASDWAATLREVNRHSGGVTGPTREHTSPGRKQETGELVSSRLIRLFISHSAEDARLAERLIELIRLATDLPAAAIRCTSVEGHRLPGGADTDEQLRREVHDSEAFIGIVSASSVRSTYVLFELGARWGAGKHLIPLLAPGAGTDVLGGPLAGLNAMRADIPAQLHQLLQELAERLSLQLHSPALFAKHLQAVIDTPHSSTIGKSQNAPTEMAFKAPFYYKVGDTVPFCPSCWESDGKAIHVHGPIHVASGTRFDCPQCDKLFIAERPGAYG